jgi:hypothetical protein
MDFFLGQLVISKIVYESYVIFMSFLYFVYEKRNHAAHLLKLLGDKIMYPVFTRLIIEIIKFWQNSEYLFQLFAWNLLTNQPTTVLFISPDRAATILKIEIQFSKIWSLILVKVWKNNLLVLLSNPNFYETSNLWKEISIYNVMHQVYLICFIIRS